MTELIAWFTRPDYYTGVTPLFIMVVMAVVAAAIVYIREKKG